MSENEYLSAFDAESDVLKVEIDCVTPPNEEQLEGIREFICRKYKTDEVSFVIKKDPSVKGGFKLFVGDDK